MTPLDPNTILASLGIHDEAQVEPATGGVAVLWERACEMFNLNVT